MTTELKAGIVPWRAEPTFLMSCGLEDEHVEVWLIASSDEDARRIELFIGSPSVRARLLRALEEALAVLDSVPTDDEEGA